MNHESYDVIVIGGGPAGLSAALLLGRALRSVLVIDGGEPRNLPADHVHGLLGNENLPPSDLLAKARSEVQVYGVEVVAGEVERVDETAAGVDVLLVDGSRASARALVAASGLVDVLPDIPGLAEKWGSGVFHCPYCHGWEVRGRRLGVLTTSPMGMHQAQMIRQWSEDVTVFTAGLGSLDMVAEFRLRSRGVRLVAPPVVEIRGEGRALSSVVTADGTEIELDALLVGPSLTPRDGYLAHLGLDRSETPMGRFLATDPTGRTSSSRIWAVGNVADPGATVAVSIGEGAAAAGALNGMLIAEDFDSAMASRETWPRIAPSDYWEHRYSGPDSVWSGRVNAVLADVATTLESGTALDLGCGEGADVVWLAQHGWRATGIDIASSAIARAREAAARLGVSDTATFETGDVGSLPPGREFDLVTASFLHSPVDLPRGDILRAAADRVAPGGHLLITSHAAVPPRANIPEALTPTFLTPEEEVTALALDPADWELVTAELRPRETTGRDGLPALIEDSVVLFHRSP